MFLFFVVSILICVLGVFGTKDVKTIEKQTNEKTSMKDVLFNKKLIYYLIVVCVFYGVTNVNSIYLPVMYQHNGLTVSKATTVIFAGTMMELPVILLSRFYMNKIGNKQLLIISFACCSIYDICLYTKCCYSNHYDFFNKISYNNGIYYD